MKTRRGTRWQAGGKLLLAAGLLLLGACAARGPVLSEQLPGPAAPELTETPFFAQEAYQCGPAALATVLVASGVDTDPAALVEQVYLPGRQGSLQAELMAATRRHERIAYPVDGGLGGLHAALHAGLPVLVLLNLGLDTFPVWHYAVVVGLDPAGDAVVLRSGTERRRLLAARRFVAAWERADRWGMAVTAPGAIPAFATEPRWIAAAAALESAGRAAAAESAYRAALARWPQASRARFGLGNALYLQGRYAAAGRAYRAYLEVVPDDAVAWNNLALAQHGAGDPAAARTSLARAAAHAGSPALAAVVEETRAEIAASDPAARQ